MEAGTGDGLADLHLWRVGPQDLAAIISVVTHEPHPPEHYRDLAEAVHPLSHVTVEVRTCEHGPPADG